MDAETRDPRTYEIIGAAKEVHRMLGQDFLEAVYQEALALELDARAIPFRREAPLAITYKDSLPRVSYKVDFICFESVIVELEALARLSENESSQVMNYIRASSIGHGLLLNFGGPSLEYKRFIHPILRKT